MQTQQHQMGYSDQTCQIDTVTLVNKHYHLQMLLRTAREFGHIWLHFKPEWADDSEMNLNFTVLADQVLGVSVYATVL
jgi:hypothetical protein